MNYKALADLTGLHQKAIKVLEKKGVISENLTDEHLFFMTNLSRIWGDEELLRLQLSRHNSSRRAKLVFGSGYNRWERAIIHRFLYHYSDREDNKYNLHVSQVVDEIMNYNSFPEAFRKVVTDTAYRLRRKVSNMIYRKIELREIAERLTVGKKQKPKISETVRSAAAKARHNEIFGNN